LLIYLIHDDIIDTLALDTGHPLFSDFHAVANLTFAVAIT